MNYYLIHFFIYNKIYLLTGALLLVLIILPTKERISAKTQKTLYLALFIWIISFAYRINTGQDIIYLLNNNGNLGNEHQPRKMGGPFNKYYSNEAGRKQ